MESGIPEAVFARTFEHLTHGGLTPEWPQQLELSLSNSCNLQCVMCNGEWSSSIRAHREMLPPLPRVYDDRFFEELAAFIPHLEVVKFLGGEPFIGHESIRVMEMLIELQSSASVHITTNGTQWSPRIERILDNLRAHIVVSLDGITKETYESIRVGATFEQVIRNVDRFIERSMRGGLGFSISHCLMVPNWREFPDLLQFAEHHGILIWINTVTEPHVLSLYHLPTSSLRQVVQHLTDLDAQMQSSLSESRLQVWLEQLDRLRIHLERLEAFRPPDYIARRLEFGFSWLAPQEQANLAQREMDKRIASRSGLILHVSDQEIVVEIERRGKPGDELVTFIEEHNLLGNAFPAELRGPDFIPNDDQLGSDIREYSVDIPLNGREKLRLVIMRIAHRDSDGVIDGIRVWLEQAERSDRLARAAAGDGARIFGFTIDSQGRIDHVLEDQFQLLSDLHPSLKPVRPTDLIEHLSRVVGRTDGPVKELDSTDGIGRYCQGLVSPDGQKYSAEAFVETVDHVTSVWVVLHPLH